MEMILVIAPLQIAMPNCCSADVATFANEQVSRLQCQARFFSIREMHLVEL